MTEEPVWEGLDRAADSDAALLEPALPDPALPEPALPSDTVSECPSRGARRTICRGSLSCRISPRKLSGEIVMFPPRYDL